MAIVGHCDTGFVGGVACVEYAPRTGSLLYLGNTMSKKANQDIKQLRAIGHKLKPVVTIAGNGLTEGVIAELDRALNDHELIKIKLAVGSREARSAVAAEVCERSGAELVQSIGNVMVILRRTDKPDPRLSNLIRRL